MMNTLFYFPKKLCGFRSLICVTVCLAMVRCYLEITSTNTNELYNIKRLQKGISKDVVIENSRVPSTVHGQFPKSELQRELRDKSKYYFCDTFCLLNLSRQLNKITTDWSTWTYDKMIDCPKLNFTKIRQQNFPRFIHMKCETPESKIGNKIQVIPYGSKCLDNYIKTYCKDNTVVPNLVHYVWYGVSKVFAFYGFLSFVSVIRFVRPCAIFIHGNTLPSGPYWDYILNLYPNIIHVKRMIGAQKIYGKKVIYSTHHSDVLRIEALLMYGGIYLDMDMVLVKEIDFLRRYPCTMSRMRQPFLASSFIMSEKNSSFLNKWLDGYKYHYRNDSYIYSAMKYPNMLAKNFTGLIHIEEETLSRPWEEHGDKIYHSNFDWSNIFGMHLCSRLYKDTAYKTVMVNKKIIRRLNTTFGAIARHILYGNKELCLN